MPISFSIEPTTRFLRTVVTGRVGREDMVGYATDLRAHPLHDEVDRRLVDVRASAQVTADELRDMLRIEHETVGNNRRADRRAILINSEAGPALGRELVVADRRTYGVPISYRVFRSATHVYRYLRVEPRFLADRSRPRRAATD